MYSAAQIPLLSRIVALRDMGFGVEEIEEVLPHYDNADYMRKTLDKKHGQITSVIADEHDKLERIAAMRGKLREEHINMIYEVELKSLPAEKVISLRETIPAENEETLWEKLWTFIKENNIKHGAGGYSIYHGDEYEENDIDTEISVPVSELSEDKGEFKYQELAAIPQAATIRFSGSYENYGAAMEKLAVWIENNGYAIDGSVRGFAIASPTDVQSPDDYMTELQIHVRKA
jgi:effector-binding domain-containing protein